LPLLDSLNTNPATCNLNNGSAKIYPYGGTVPYTYQWSSGCVIQTCINLTPGLHTVTVTDANGCQIVRTTNIGEIPIHVIAADSTSDPDCFGGSDGSVYISVTAGATPYSYLWSNGAVTQDIAGITAGTYTVTVTDSVNCAVSQPFNISQPDSIQDGAIVVDATCGLFNGSINLAATGGTGALQYFWSNAAVTSGISSLEPGSYTVTVTDVNSCTGQFSYQITDIPGPVISLIQAVDATCFSGNDGSITIDVSSGTQPFDFLWNNGEVTQNVSGLDAGTYTVTVTDDNNCVADTSFTISEPDEITAIAQIDDVACGSTDGSITVQPSGGTGNYDYLWNNLAITQTISNLGSGTYTVTVTDDSGCSSIFQFNVIDAGGPTATIGSVTPVACFGDSTGVININIIGGAVPFTYQWSNGFAGEDLQNVPAGSYTVTVTDQNNCTATLSQIITQPSQIVASFDVTPANCNTSNGQIVASVSGGTGILNLLWSSGSGATSIVNLSAAIYTLTVTDQTGCSEVFIVPVNNLSAPVITVTDSSNVTCSGAQNGSITVNVTGGQLPYVYSWTNTPQTTPVITGLVGNTTYTLTVTDGLGCVAIRPVLITEPSPISITAIIPQRNDTFNLSCNGSNDGSIDINVSGGVSPYTYIWSNLAQTDSIFGLAAGTYTVTVTDQNGCTVAGSFSISQPPLLVSNAGQNNIICGINSDTLDANVPVFGTGYWTIVNGFGLFQDSVSNNTIVTDLAEGVNVFQWVVTDGLCSAVSQVVITYNTQIVAIPGFNRTVCADTVLLTATAPQFGFGYWQIISSDATITDSAKAVTSVTGLNFGPNRFRWIVVNGTCSDTAEVVIFRNDPEACIEDIELPTGFTPNDDNRNDFFIVKGIGDYPENTFVVYNRWGNKVYEKSGYANEWNGVNQSGDPLPEGTYFIILKVRKGSRTFTGYVDLRR
jgi:gliding motility-associated-like protein